MFQYALDALISQRAWQAQERAGEDEIDGTKAKAAAAIARVGVALEADRLLVLHDARHQETHATL